MAKVIFYQENGVKELDRWISLHLKDGDIVFERDRHFYPRAKTYKDYLTEKDCHEIDALALRVSENWYKEDSGKDLTSFEDISLGRMVEYKLMKYFVSLFKDIAVLAKIREKENPESFVFIDDRAVFSGLLKEFSKKYAIKKEALTFSSAAAETSARRNERRLRENIKSLILRLFTLLPKRSRVPHKKTIIIEAYGKFIPLIKRLAKEGNRIILTGKSAFGKGLLHPNIFYYSWPSFQAKPVGCHCEQTFAAISSRSAVFDSFDAGPFIKKKLEETVSQDFPSIRAAIPEIKKFLTCREADAVITLQDRDGINRILAASGNFLGLNTVEIQHGTLSNLPHLVSPVSRKLCLWGRAGREFYLKRQIDEKRLHIVGDSNLNELKRAGCRETAKLRKILGLSPGKPTVLFASQPFIKISSLDSPLETLDLFECVCEAAQKLPEIEFLIKFHPGEDSKPKREILKRYRSGNCIVAGRGVSAELLSLSSLLITFCSSIVLEASLLKVPVITVNLTGKKDFLPLAEMGGALGVYRKKDLIPSVKAALYDKEIQKKLGEGQERFIESQIDLREDSFKKMAEVIQSRCVCR
jgi:hypothetical protein